GRHATGSDRPHGRSENRRGVCALSRAGPDLRRAIGERAFTRVSVYAVRRPRGARRARRRRGSRWARSGGTGLNGTESLANSPAAWIARGGRGVGRTSVSAFAGASHGGEADGAGGLARKSIRG